MQIHGLESRLSEIGKIKIGKKGKWIKSKQGKDFRLPEKFKHFVITTTEKDENDDFIINQEIMKKIGEDCKCLDVILLSDDIDVNFPNYYAYYLSGKRLCKGDGIKATRLVDGKEKEVECKGDKGCIFGDYQVKRCKMNGILSVCLADQLNIGGVYVHRTTGVNSITTLKGSMEYISLLSGEQLAYIPLQLKMHALTVYPDGKAKVVYPVHLEFPGDYQLLIETALKVTQVIESGKIKRKEIELQLQKLIAAPETEEEITDIEEEFYPPEEGEEEIELQDNLSPEEQAQMKKADALFKKLDWLIGKAHACKKNYEGNLPGLIEYLEKQLKVAKTKPPKASVGSKKSVGSIESEEPEKSKESVDSGEPEEPKKEVSYF